MKCIYIDPPYNTGSDGFVYNDNFNYTVEELSEKLSISDEQAQRILDLTKRGSASHSAWLMFMYPRLLLATMVKAQKEREIPALFSGRYQSYNGREPD